MTEHDLKEYIKQRAVVLIIFLVAASILLLVKGARAEDAAWSPPEGMIVKSQGGTCFVPAERGTIVQTCDWGPRGNDSVAGTAYFRVCRSVMEPQPFLVADYERNELVYTGYDNRVIDGPGPEGSDWNNLREMDHDYMFSFLDDYEFRNGICETK